MSYVGFSYLRRNSLIFNEFFFNIFSKKFGKLGFISYLYYVIKNEIYEFTV